MWCFFFLFKFHYVRPVLSPSLLLYFSCTGPWLHYVPAVWNNVYFVALLNTFCVYFLFWEAEAVLPSAVACLFFSFSWCLSLFFILLVRSLVIWFIVFTAVNFHLVLFFFQFFIQPPSPASCEWALRCGCDFGGWLCHPGSFLHCSWPLSSPVTSALSPLWPYPLYPAFTPLPIALYAWRVPFALVLGRRFLLSPVIPPCTTLFPHTPKPMPPSRWPTPLMSTATVSPTRARSLHRLPWVLITAQSAGSKSGEGGSSCSQ